MKWFKHQSNARNDERIAHLTQLAGLEGYGFYFMLLELVAEHVDGDKCSLTYPVTVWSRALNLHHNKFSSLLGKCEVTGLVEVRYHEGDYGGRVEVIIPKLLNYRDNHNNNLQAKNKNKEEDKKKELELEKEKNNPPTPLAGGGEISKTKIKPKSERKPSLAAAAEAEWWPKFWAVYPRRDGKHRALEAWRKAVDAGADPENLMLCAGSYNERCQENKTEQRFMKMPQTWLNGKCWEDEQDEVDAANIVWTEADQWRTRLRSYQKSNIWFSDMFGPAPGTAGCGCPPEVLREFGYEVAPPPQAQNQTIDHQHSAPQ